MCQLARSTRNTGRKSRPAGRARQQVVEVLLDDRLPPRRRAGTSARRRCRTNRLTTPMTSRNSGRDRRADQCRRPPGTRRAVLQAPAAAARSRPRRATTTVEWPSEKNKPDAERALALLHQLAGRRCRSPRCGRRRRRAAGRKCRRGGPSAAGSGTARKRSARCAQPATLNAISAAYVTMILPRTDLRAAGQALESRDHCSVSPEIGDRG